MIECLAEFSESLKRINIMDICLQINDEDYITSLFDDYGQPKSLEAAAKSLNLNAFLIIATKSFSLLMGSFGITEIFKFISLGELEINLALIYAAFNNNVDSISKLTELGANIEAKDDLFEK